MIGVDEVGRGSLAGPLLVVAARELSPLPLGLTDSKLLSRQQRQELFVSLIDCCEFGEGWVKATEIDRLGLAKAMRLGVKRALSGLGCTNDEEIVMDGIVNYIPKKYSKRSCRVKADREIPIVSAASVFAKVTRDTYMWKLAERHPGYGFESHVGYCTELHMEALSRYGLLARVHRLSFNPFKSSA